MYKKNQNPNQERREPPSNKKQQNRQGTQTPQRRVFPIWPILLTLLIVWMFSNAFFGKNYQSISYSKFKQQLQEGNITKVEVVGETVRGNLTEPITVEFDKPFSQEPTEKEITQFQTTTPPFGDENLTDQLLQKNVEIISHGSGNNEFLLILANLLPFLLLLGIGVLILRNMSRQSGGIMNIGQSKAKQFQHEHTNVTYDDVAGCDEAKKGLQEIVTFLKHPEHFAKLGCRVPKGVLLVGPPGTGKTLLARAVAGEAGCPFYSITGSDFMEMFVGVGASRVRDMFKKAKQNTPCIIFVDELDSIGRQRGAGLGGGHDEREQTLNQLLSEIDGFEPMEKIVVIAATNRPDILDPALQRPGRFDRKVVINFPSLKERIEILKVHTKKVPIDEDINLEDIARSMPGKSGAELANLVNEAALLAARKNKDTVNKEDFSEARDKILMGHLRGGIVLTDEEKRLIAIHEAGHALVAHLIEEADPVEKVSIIPRGQALGATQQLPEERYNMTSEYLLARIKVMMGGRAAEEVFLHKISTGAENDLMTATKLARNMIKRWGMGSKFKHMAFDDEQSGVFLGEQLAQQKKYSDETEREIDLEIKALIDDCYQETQQILSDNQERLIKLADILEEEETLEGDLLKHYLNGDYDKIIKPENEHVTETV